MDKIFRDVYYYSKAYDRCQRTGNISFKNQMPMQGILIVEIFDVLDSDFMGLFSPSFGYVYILLMVDYMSKRK